MPHPNLIRASELAIATACITVLAGCGGGGSSQIASATASPSALSATFVDPPTKGLYYSDSPSGITGTTDAGGGFSYEAGDVVSFFLPTPGGNVALGTYKPVAPLGGGPAVLSVLALPNGQAVAQTLQLLNHSSTQDSEDVSGLKLSAADVQNLNSLIADGSTDQGLSAEQVFSAAQSDAEGADSALQFLLPTQLTTNTATLTALNSLFSIGIAHSQAISASAAVAGKTLLVFGGGTSNGSTFEGWYLNYYDASGNRHHMYASGSTSVPYQAAPQPYTTSGNTLTIVEPGNTLTQNYYYAAPDYGFLSETSTTGEVGKYFYMNIGESLSANALLGKTVLLGNPIACTGGARYELSFAAAASQAGTIPYVADCVAPNGTSTQVDSGTMQQATLATDGLPDNTMLKLIDGSGNPHFVGLVSGTVTDGVTAEFSPIAGYSGLARIGTS